MVLVAVALGLRLYDLGDRPFHHDESQDAYFSWVLWTKGDYKYMPILHGPLRFYLPPACSRSSATPTSPPAWRPR